MTDINTFTATGRLTKNAESKSSTSGASVVLFTLATNYYKKGAENNEEVSFLDCVSYRADKLFPYLTKGKQVCVSGMVRQRRWEKDGNKNSKVEIVVDGIKLIGDKSEGQAAQPKPTSQPNLPQNQGMGPEDFPDDDIPF